MTERIPKSILTAAVVMGMIVLVYLAYLRPAYFTSRTYLGGLLLCELLTAAVWMYRRVFFALVVVSFLLAGVSLPVGSAWAMVRWVVLGVGAMVGCAMVLKEQRCHFGLFHALAFFAVLSALVSAAVSRYTFLALSKALSLFLLFAYASTGARLAVTGRESRFFSGLIIGCEVLVGALAAFYFLGIEVMGNPNSLGAVMGVAAAPILLWAVLISKERFANHRRLALFAISMYLTFSSHARASIVAAFLSCGLLCLVLRKYRMLAQGLAVMAIFIAASAIFRPEAFSRAVSSFNSSIVYKGRDPSQGILSSRQSPWQEAIDSIRSHFWFGTGFGTADNGQDATAKLAKFSSTAETSAELGSSYLAITTWVGMLGVLPFFWLVFVLLRKVVQTIRWMVKTGNASHAAVPLAMVMLAGMIHAALEDWMFAPGYYLCVFYWSMAFVFMDYAPSPVPAFSRLAFSPPAKTVRQSMGEVTPSQ